MSPPQGRNPNLRASRAAAEWLVTCRKMGFDDEQIDKLETLWWLYHDDNGRIIQATHPTDPLAQTGGHS